MPDHAPSISTLGPRCTNSHLAAEYYIASVARGGTVVLSQTVDESFELLLTGSCERCVVCCLYPKIHELYIPNLSRVTIAHVFLHNAQMGLYTKNPETIIRKIAAPITSTVFLQGTGADIVLADSNASSVAMLLRNEVDAAVSTHSVASETQLHLVKDYGDFPVPYAVFVGR